MARLEWDRPGDRRFDSGVDRGVFYSSTRGYSWNGLTAIDENPTGTTPTPYYLDGVNIYNEAPKTEFSGGIRAFTYPSVMDYFMGLEGNGKGLHIDQQPFREFGLSYRTGLGDDLKGVERGYKIHLVHNIMINSRAISRVTRGAAPSADEFNWGFIARPVKISGYRHSAHLVIDSTETDRLLLQTIEDRLYGTEEKTPYLPTPLELIDLYETYQPTGYGYGPYGHTTYGHGSEY